MVDIEVTTGGINIEVTVNTMQITVATEEKQILIQPANVFSSGINVLDSLTTVAKATSIIFVGAVVTDNLDGTATVTIGEESVQDIVGEMVSGNTETLISVTYDDTAGKLNFVVENDLSQYDNSTSGFLTSYTETDTLQSVTDRGATTTTSITANSYLAGSWLNVTQDLFRQNTNLTGSVVLRDVSDDLLDIGFDLKGYANLYIKDTTPDINTGILMGDLSPLGLNGDTVIVGVSDFSDLEDQVQANTIYNGDITGNVAGVLTTARRVDGTLFQTNITPAGFGVLNDAGTLFVVDATKISGLLPLEITSSITAESYVGGSWLSFEQSRARINTALTGAVVLQDTSADLLDLGFDLKGHATLYINTATSDINTGFLFGDLSPLGFSGDAMIIGSQDFSDAGDQGQAGIAIQNSFTDDDQFIELSARNKADSSSYKVKIESVSGVSFEDVNDTILQIQSLGVAIAKPVSITDTSAQLNLINNGAVLTSFQTTSAGYLKVLPSGARVTIGEDVGSQNNTLNVMGSTGSTLLRIQDTDTNGTVGLIFQNDSQRWDFKVAGNASDKFTIRDATGGIDKFNIDIGATGDISFVNFGSLGVGTTSPLDKLTVLSSTPGDGIALKLPNDTNYAARIRAYNGGGILQLYGASGNVQTSIGGANDADAYFNSGGSLIVGGDTPNASAKLQADSTTQGFLPPRMTTTQRDAISSPAAGLVIYNTTTAKLNVYTTAWETITSS